MKVFVGYDHAGFKLAEKLLTKYTDFEDCGDGVYDEGDNFTDIVPTVVGNVLAGKGAFGILICGTGIGVSIAANHNRGIRAALCHSAEYAKMARAHNDANILCLGGRFIDTKTAFAVVDTFLSTPADKNPKYKKRMDIADGTVS
jgi:ribose 5-phosphate isomerase B